jgi:phosphoglycolate phosphatase-like HAD superfamily hydrolase
VANAPGVIFDIDGTLVDTNYQHALAWYLAFRQHDVHVPVWQLHRHLGMGGDQLVVAVAGQDAEDEIGDEVRTAHDVIYLTMIQSVSVFDGARGLLEDLKGDGQRVVLASSAKQREVDHYLDLLDGRELADSWTTSDDVEATKPEPNLVLAAKEKLGTDGAIVMVGDTPYDIEAAAKSDVPTIAVLTGGFAEAELREAGAVEVYASIADLRAHRAESAALKGA